MPAEAGADGEVQGELLQRGLVRLHRARLRGIPAQCEHSSDQLICWMFPGAARGHQSPQIVRTIASEKIVRIR